MKKMVVWLLLTALIFGLAGCAEKVQKSSAKEELSQLIPTQEITEREKVPFTVIVVHKDGTEKTFTYESSEKYVGPVLEEAGLLEGNEGPYGLEITSVDGEKAVYSEDGAYWAVYEEDEYALQGIDTTPIKAGRVYKLVWTKG